MGAGDVTGVGPELLAALQDEERASTNGGSSCLGSGTDAFR